MYPCIVRLNFYLCFLHSIFLFVCLFAHFLVSDKTNTQNTSANVYKVQFRFGIFVKDTLNLLFQSHLHCDITTIFVFGWWKSKGSETFVWKIYNSFILKASQVIDICIEIYINMAKHAISNINFEVNSSNGRYAAEK